MHNQKLSSSIPGLQNLKNNLTRPLTLLGIKRYLTLVLFNSTNNINLIPEVPRKRVSDTLTNLSRNYNALS